MHEINNPLAYVVSNLEMMVEEIRVLARRDESGPLHDLKVMIDDARKGRARARHRRWAQEHVSPGGGPKGAARRAGGADVRHRFDRGCDPPAYPRIDHFEVVPRVDADEGSSDRCS